MNYVRYKLPWEEGEVRSCRLIIFEQGGPVQEYRMDLGHFEFHIYRTRPGTGGDNYRVRKANQLDIDQAISEFFRQGKYKEIDSKMALFL